MKVKRYLDSSVLIESCLSRSPKFEAADALVTDSESCTSAHALAESYATLSGDPRLRISPSDAAQMVSDLAKAITVRDLPVEDYRQVIATAPAKGIRGGAIYDALHAQAARRYGCQEVHTLNVSHFQHVAPDLTVIGL